MTRGGALLGSALFLALAPGIVAGVIPWWVSKWAFSDAFFPGARWIGIALIAAGLPVLLDSFFRFAWVGRGTPAPVAPTNRLVVAGLYRYVRNPMYVAVVSLILGQALLFGSLQLLIYAAAIWLGFHLFVTLYEEPTLKRSYPAEYEEYRRHVRRWLPRLSPWRG